MKTKGLTLRCLAALVALPIGSTFGGDLNPPVGPIGPTMKPLDQIEPRIPLSSETTPGDSSGTASVFKITQPGSYYLTGNLAGLANRHGIEIDASDVMLDLTGFAVQGPGLNGIVVTGTHSNIMVRNGTVSGWTADGINMAGFGAATAVVVERIAASGNGDDGINLGGRVVIRDCTADGNGQNGLNTLGESFITSCMVSSNGSDGIGCSGKALVTRCLVVNNAVDGIEVGTGSVVTENVCNANGAGLGAGGGVYVTGVDCRVDSNTVSANDYGIHVSGVGNLITRNFASDNEFNYGIVSGNRVGFVVIPPNSGGISGSVGGAGVGTTDPWANFSF